MDRQHTHANWALLPLGKFPKRTNIQLRAKIELASSFIKHLLDKLALLFMLVSVIFLASDVAIPNTLAGRARLDSITFLAARRAELG